MIDATLLNEIIQYCELNNIDDVNRLINKMLKRGFTIEKFGDKPFAASQKPKDVIKEEIPDKEESINKYTITNNLENKLNTKKDLYGE
jgi:pentatricopeptide repeat protein